MAIGAIDDSCLFATSPRELLSAIRAAAMKEAVDERPNYLLSRCGLLGASELTEAGLALFKLTWVIRDDKAAIQALGQALRQLTPLQVIEQEMRGLGPVMEDGVLDLLLHHRAVPMGTTAAELRATFRWLNSAGVVAYSTKHKTVRGLTPAPDAALAGEVQAIAAMISPRTPFLNVVKLRRVIRPLRGIVWWADPHFAARALEELAEELNTADVKEVRIISGDADSVVSTKSLKDFERFKEEMANQDIHSEWRIDSRRVRDWHDRWLGDDRYVWNVPPVNTIFKNDYSEISPASQRPPFDEWWMRSTPR